MIISRTSLAVDLVTKRLRIFPIEHLVLFYLTVSDNLIII